MKKKFLFISILLLVMIMTACNASLKTSFSNLGLGDEVPANIKNLVDPNLTLQVLKAGKGHYIVYQTNGDVLSSEVQNSDDSENVKINLEVINEQPNNDQTTFYYFYLETEPKKDLIEVYVNGKLTPFDNIANE